MTPTLMQHQQEGLDFLRSHNRAALLDEPGLGKSAQALIAAEEPVLVAAPAMLVTGGVWDDEVAKWTPGKDVTQVPYSQLFVRDGRKSTAKLKPELRRQWGTVIADESHYLKNRKAFWTNAFCSLRHRSLFQLTGTPIPNWAHEAFVMLMLLRPEEAKPGGEFGSYWRWVQKWFDVGPKYNRAGRKLTDWDIGELKDEHDWDDFREANWGDRALRRLRADVLDLPPVIEQTIRVDMKGEQARVYKDLKKDFVAWLDSGEEIVAWNQAAQFMKLWLAGTVVGDGGAKLTALQEVLALRDRPTLVVAHFRKSVEAAARVASEVQGVASYVHGGVSPATREHAIRQFQHGEVPVLCASLGTISEGFTFTNADQVIFLERSPVPSKNEQALRRLHRIGQDRPVTKLDLITRGSIDERVLDLLEGKTDQQASAIPREELRHLA